MNEQPENIIAHGHKFKRSQLQDFVDGLNHQQTIKPVDLLKIKHLFYTSLRLKIDFRDALKALGVVDIPRSLRGLECLNLGESEIGCINAMYNAQRSIDLADPQPKIKYSSLKAADNLKRAISQTGYSIS